MALEDRPRHRGTTIDTHVNALERRHAEQHQEAIESHPLFAIDEHREVPLVVRNALNVEGYLVSTCTEQSGIGFVQVAYSLYASRRRRPSR